MSKLKSLGLALTFALIGFIGGSILMFNSATGITANPAFEPVLAQTAPLLTDVELVRANVYQSVSQSIVSIGVFSTAGAGSGSGFVIDTQGHIMTNNHVVDTGGEITVSFFDGTITRAVIVGLDPDSDLAIIKVDLPAERLKPVAFGDSDALTIGQNVLAIGSPFGQEWTLTSGIISALNRSIEGLAGYQIGAAIQTDTAINPGNSGGPLLNTAGQVIGINSQILSEVRANSGVGFAIPSNLAQRVARELIETGQVRYSFVGIRGGDVNLTIIEQFGLSNNQRGVVVSEATAGGPAAAAGLQSGDIITAVDGVELLGFETLISYLAQNTVPGDTVSMTVLRNGQNVIIPVTLQNRPGR